MKKIFFFIIVFMAHSICFSQNIEWKVIKDSNVYRDETGLSEYFLFKVVKKGSVINGSKTSIYSCNSPEYNYLLVFNGDNYIDAEAVIPNGTTDLFSETVLTPALHKQGKTLFSTNHLEILKSKKRDTAWDYSPKSLTAYEKSRSEYDCPWWESSQSIVENTRIFQTIIDVDNFYNWATFYITDIQRKENRYELQTICDSWFIRDTLIPQDEQPKQGDKVKYPSELIMYFDGDYMDIFYNGKYFLGSYAVVDEEFGDIFEQFLETNTCDLSNITWPRRADKNHSVGATCIVAESLRLRKEENTSSATLQIMQPGTQVQIRQLGKKQTIDGITANWVQVQLADDTTGWCFGGYLVEK